MSNERSPPGPEDHDSDPGQPRRPDITGVDLLVFWDAVKWAGVSGRAVAFQYEELGESERLAHREKTDRFIAQLTLAWNLLREGIA